MRIQADETNAYRRLLIALNFSDVPAFPDKKLAELYQIADAAEALRKQVADRTVEIVRLKRQERNLLDALRSEGKMDRKELATSLRILANDVEYYEPLQYDAADVADKLEYLLGQVGLVDDWGVLDGR